MEFKIEKIEGHKNWRLINNKRRKFTHVISNVYKFNYKGEVYHCIVLSDDYIVFKFNYTSPKHRNPINSTNYRFFNSALLDWVSLERQLKDLVAKYSSYETEDKWVSAAPDTTKFKAKVSGHIAYRDNYSKHHYSGIYTNYTHLIEKGSNLKLPQEYYDELGTIYLSHILAGIKLKSESGKVYTPMISWFYGTSWIGIGLTA